MQVVKNTPNFRQYFPQILAGVSVTLVLVQLGLSSGWSSPYMAKLRQSDSPIFLSPQEISWITSTINLGRLLGSIIGSIMLNYYGCKTTLMLSLLPMAGCWFCTIVANNALWLCVSRLNGGISLGITYISFPLYLGEVSLPKIRGAMVSSATCGGTFGVMMGMIVGSLVSMKISGSIYLALCCLLFAIFLCLPESPHHLVKIGDLERARKAVEWYRGGYEVDEELESIRKFVANANSETLVYKLKQFRHSRALLRATILVVLLFTFMQLSGFNCVLFYMETILIDGKVNLVKPSIIVSAASGSAVLASLISVFLIDRCGRRLLTVVSSVGVSISMCALGTHFYTIENNVENYDNDDLLQLVPIASMFLFDVTFFSGLMSVPSIVMSEVFPANVKCIAAFICTIAGAFFAFLSTISYQYLIEIIGQSNVFFAYAFITILLVPYALFCMPETKGKTLQEIQDKLVSRY